MFVEDKLKFVEDNSLCRLFLNIFLTFIILESCEVTGTKVETDVPLNNPGNLSF